MILIISQPQNFFISNFFFFSVLPATCLTDLSSIFISNKRYIIIEQSGVMINNEKGLDTNSSSKSILDLRSSRFNWKHFCSNLFLFLLREAFKKKKKLPNLGHCPKD